ncbi:hypothetical protein [Actinophytocola oryzae]|uniref:Outer membrane channel protein CpnT-like N-terminal domain-containing protein n=1 Tax=Actinophytocola oryzae TaxID=502181 RepID=A0A4V3FSS8_9PSEU|nr:hypothetical protein [Actinophytocola oryzae]TDV48661.1 hypothetical protein CLV71_10821 [Actinophytocola oryzae]
MTDLPASLQAFLEVTVGMPWPEGDERDLERSSDAWMAFRAGLATARDQYGALAREFDAVLVGETAERVVVLYDSTVPASLDQMIEAADTFAAAMLRAAADFEKTKIMIVAMLVLLAAAIAELLASLFGAFLIPTVVAVARVGIAAVLKQLSVRLGSVSFRQLGGLSLRAGRQLAVDVAKYGLAGAAFMGGLDLAVDGVQNLTTTEGGQQLREGVDWNAFFMSAALGALGGGFYGVGRSLGRAADVLSRDFRTAVGVEIEKMAGREVRSRASRAFQGFADLGYSAMQVAIGGAAANATINVAQGPLASALRKLFPPEGGASGDSGGVLPMAAASDGALSLLGRGRGAAPRLSGMDLSVGDLTVGTLDLGSLTVGSLDLGETPSLAAFLTGKPATATESSSQATAAPRTAATARMTTDHSTAMPAAEAPRPGAEAGAETAVGGRDAVASPTPPVRDPAASATGSGARTDPVTESGGRTAAALQATRLSPTTPDHGPAVPVSEPATSAARSGTQSDHVMESGGGAGALHAPPTPAQTGPSIEPPTTAAGPHVRTTSVSHSAPIAPPDSVTPSAQLVHSSPLVSSAQLVHSSLSAHVTQTGSVAHSSSGAQSSPVTESSGPATLAAAPTRPSAEVASGQPGIDVEPPAASPVDDLAPGRPFTVEHLPVGIFLRGRGDDRFVAPIAALPAIPGEFGVAFRDGLRMTVTALAEAVRAAGWNGTDTIRLYVCDTGDLARLAQGLANSLGAPVERPTDLLWLGLAGTAAQVGPATLTADGRIVAPAATTDPDGGGWVRHEPHAVPVPSSYSGTAPSLPRPMHLADTPTTRIHRLLPLNLVRVEEVDGGRLRADVEQALNTAGTPPGVRDQVLAGLSDAELTDKITKADRLTVTAGQGDDAVELSVRPTLADDTTGKSTKDYLDNGKIESSSGKYGKAKLSRSGTRSKDGTVGGHLPLSSALDLGVNLKGGVPSSTWKSVSSAESRSGTAIEPSGDRTSSRHDLRYTATLTGNGTEPVRFDGHQPGGAVVSTPDALADLTIDPVPTPDSDGATPPAVRLTAGGLFDAAREVLHRHPAWRGRADEIGSPVRAVLRGLTSGDHLSQRGTDLLDGHPLRESLEIHDTWGTSHTATIELLADRDDSYALRLPTPVKGKLTSKSGTTTGHSLEVSRAEKVDLGVRLKSGAHILGENVGAVGLVQGGRTNHDERVTTRGSEVSDELAWTAKGTLAGRVTDLTYRLRVVFDDGRQEETRHAVLAAAVTWRAVNDEAPAAEHLPDTDPFPPRKILTGETRFPNLAAVEETLRHALPAGVLHAGEATSAAHVAQNEAAVSRVFSARGAADRSSDLNGDGMSSLLVSSTSAVTGSPDGYVQVVVEAVRPESEASAARPRTPGASLKGTLGAERTTGVEDTVRTGYTAGGGGGLRGSIGGVGTGELRGQHSRTISAAESTLTSSSGVGHEQTWKSAHVGTHDHLVDHYRITVHGDDGVLAVRTVPGGRAATFTGGRFAPGHRPVEERSAFTPVPHRTPRRPDGWREGALPDHFVVQGVDLPTGLADALRAGLGKAEVDPFARHTTHEFAGRRQVAARLVEAESGVLQLPVHRRGTGLLAGDHVGDVKVHLALSNPRIVGEPETMKLTFAATVTGATGRSATSGTGTSTAGRFRAGSKGDFEVHEAFGYSDGGRSEAGQGTVQEFEHTTVTTYEGPVYPVAYDVSVLAGGRDAVAGTTVAHGDEPGSWHNREAHRENAVRLWVPADELGQLGLTDVPPTSRTAPAEHADVVPPDHDIDGFTPRSVRPEVTARLLDATRDLLDLVPRESVPRPVLSRFLGGVTDRAVFAWVRDQVNGDVERRAGESLYRRIVAELGARGLEPRYPDLVSGPGIRWSETVAGPVGTYTVALTLRGNEGLGEYHSTTPGWTGEYETKTTRTTTKDTGGSRSRQLASRTFLGTDAVGGHPLRGVGTIAGTHRSSGDRTESVAVSATRAYTAPDGDTVTYVHDLGLELTVTKTAHASRAPRVLSHGLADLFTPRPWSGVRTLDAIPGAVRSKVPVGELGAGARRPGRIDTLPDHRTVLARSLDLHFTVREIVDGVPVGESTGRAPTAVPAQATSTLDTINTGTRPSALSAHLPEAMGDKGYLLDGLDLDGYYSAGAVVSNPLAALRFNAYLDGARVVPLAGSAEFTAKDSTTHVAKDKRKEGPGVKTGGRTRLGDVEAGTGGPGAAWQHTSAADTRSRSGVREEKTTAAPFLVIAWANWTVVPEYLGAVPDEWRVPRTARDRVYVRTDEAGLRRMGLEPPP